MSETKRPDAPPAGRGSADPRERAKWAWENWGPEEMAAEFARWPPSVGAAYAAGLEKGRRTERAAIVASLRAARARLTTAREGSFIGRALGVFRWSTWALGEWIDGIENGEHLK